MSRTAFVLGASGQVGTAVIPALLADGWQVRVGSRSPHEWPDGVEGVRVDRNDDAELAAAIGEADAVVDCIAYTEHHARQLASLAGSIGSAIVLSTVSVYADAAGRTLDEATGANDFPDYPVPVRESQVRTVASDATYSTRKVAVENVLREAEIPVTILRPGAIYGPGSVHPRELWFVKRALDDRPIQILNWGGHSRFHISNAANIAELVRLAAANPARRELNAVDAEAPTTSEIGAIFNELLDHHPREILISGYAVEGTTPLGDTPWSVPKPFVMDMTAAAEQLGYSPVATLAGSAPALVEWIRSTIAERSWQEAFPAFLRANGEAAFDYAAEDEWFAEQD